MKVSLEWLAEYVDIEGGPEQLAELLTATGTEVDGVQTFGSAAVGVVAARVDGVRPHPDADSLRIATIFDGRETREIVCGAPNLTLGMLAFFALEGSLLPAVSKKPLKKAKLRGVDSPGMLLSAAELGMGDDHSGIISLDPDTVPGTPLEEMVQLEDVVLDLDITPNRPDCMSIIGIAREISAATGARLRRPEIDLSESNCDISTLVSISVDDAEGCPRYSARAVNDVRIASSPFWIQRRLRACGLRPVNNVVDVTNYVLLEYGQPLHGFDLDNIGGNEIRVRRAASSEKITTLDGNERELSPEMLVIADATRPVAVAGVMGGENSEVRDESTNILIESACFSPTSVYLTSKRLGLRTDASSRYERGTDPGITLEAASRAVSLISSIAGGNVCAGMIDCGGAPEVPEVVKLRPRRVNDVLGTEIQVDFMVDVLQKLECSVLQAGDSLEVIPPTSRRDLYREADLIEEVARLNGFAGIPSGLPPATGFSVGLSDIQLLERRLVDSLVSQGLSEALSYSFMDSGDVIRLGLPKDADMARLVKVINPVAETGDVMRTTLLPGLARIAARNINRGNRDISIFEKGRIFMNSAQGELPEERDAIGIILTGSSSVNWLGGGEPTDFFDLKGVIEVLSEDLGVETAFEKTELPFLVPGRSARLSVEGVDFGFAGQLHPDVAEAFELQGDVYVAEFNTEEVFSRAALMSRYVPFGRYPSVKVDLAVVVDNAVSAGDLHSAILKAGGEMLKSINLFDLYSGEQIPAGKKSLAYALEFASATETLNDETAHARLERIIRVLTREFGASIRGRDAGQEG